MSDIQYSIGIDQIPGYAALILVRENDIYLAEAGRKYREYFNAGMKFEGRSVLEALTDSERHALCSEIDSCVKKREEFSYFRKAPVSGREDCWIRVRASYLKDVNGASLYLAIAEEMSKYLTIEKELKKSIKSLENAKTELMFDWGGGGRK